MTTPYNAMKRLLSQPEAAFVTGADLTLYEMGGARRVARAGEGGH